jgi:hypothetical protein
LVVQSPPLIPPQHTQQQCTPTTQRAHKKTKRSGDVRKIMDDAAAFKPTGFAGVPRVFDRVYAGAMAKVKQASPLRQLIFKLAFAWKAWRVRSGAKPDLATPIADAIVFSKVWLVVLSVCFLINLRDWLWFALLDAHEKHTDQHNPPSANLHHNTQTVQGRDGRQGRGHHERRRALSAARAGVHAGRDVLRGHAGVCVRARLSGGGGGVG